MGKKKKNCYNKLLDDLDSIEGDLKKLDALIVKLRDDYYPNDGGVPAKNNDAYAAICKLFLEHHTKVRSEGEA